MKSKIFLLLLAGFALGQQTANAKGYTGKELPSQQMQQLRLSRDGKARLMSGSFLHNNSNAAQKTTGGDSRLVALANYESSGGPLVPTDSTTYSFSGSNGGDLTTPDMPFDEAVSYNAAGNGYVNSKYIIQSLNGSLVEFQLLLEWNGGWYESRQYKRTFDGSKNLVGIEVYAYSPAMGWVNEYMVSIDYDPSIKKPVEERHAQWDGNEWVNQERYVYGWDASGGIGSYITEDWDGSQWVGRDLDKYSYDSDGKLILDDYREYDANVGDYVNVALYEHAYNGNKQVATIKASRWDGGTWRNHTIDYYSYDAAGNPFMDVVRMWDDISGTYVNYARIEGTYNGWNQIMTISRRTWLNGKWRIVAGDFLTNCYYQVYAKSTSVSTINSSVQSLRISPNPAVNEFALNAKFSNATNFSVSIVDAMGRTIRQWNEPATAVYSKTVATSDLAAGTYFIKVNTGNEQLTERVLVQH